MKCFSFAEFLEINIQHSVYVRILPVFPFIAYTRAWRPLIAKI